MVWVCPDCRAGYELRLSRCRACGGDGPMEEAKRVPKANATTGMSDKHAGPGEPGYVEPDQPAGNEEGGGGPSRGSSSSASSARPGGTSQPSPGAGQRRARTTGNPSGQDRAGSGSARGTGGSSRGTSKAGDG